VLDLNTISIIDVDTHVSEPRDLWTSRVPAKFRDRAPTLVFDAESKKDRWQIGDHMVNSVGEHSHAGWPEFYPSLPATLDEIDPASWDPQERLKHMDKAGLAAQVLYPNILGFRVAAFLDLGDPELILACVQAYNDFQAEFASADPNRLVPLMFLPFWDLDASMAEMDRCVALGHRGINFGTEFEKLGMPRLRDAHWTPLLSKAEEMELPISFHIGFSSLTEEAWQKVKTTNTLDIAKESAMFFLSNISSVAELIMSGICARHPKLNFVSVESGFGYIPYLLDALDWQFLNMGDPSSHRDFLMPSEYFKRQIYATFWFEKHVARLVDLYPDNLMFESDFPHPTSLSPGAGSFAKSPIDTITQNMVGVPDDIMRKVLHDTAAKLYKLP
jgi:predicted TIM-barrel fold metal-dependent hydrolase